MDYVYLNYGTSLSDTVSVIKSRVSKIQCCPPTLAALLAAQSSKTPHSFYNMRCLYNMWSAEYIKGKLLPSLCIHWLLGQSKSKTCGHVESVLGTATTLHRSQYQNVFCFMAAYGFQ